MNTQLLGAALVLFVGTTASAATVNTYVYNIGDEVGGFNTPLSSDGWTGGDLPNWKVGSYSGELYTRNTNDGDQTILRSNDGSFGFTIPDEVIAVSLEITARTPRFWEAGLTDGASLLLNIGGDFGNDDKFYIQDRFNRIKETTANASGDAINVLRLDFDVVNGTADLTLNNSTLLIDDAAMTLTKAQLLGADSLRMRTNSRFAGVAQYKLTVTSIPEPGAMTAGLAMSGLFMLKRRRRRFL